MPDVGYIPDGSGGAPHGLAENWNGSGHDHGNAYDAPFCVDGGDYPCTIFGDTDDAFDGAGSDRDSYENGYPGGGNPQGGDGSSNNNGRYSPNFWGGGGGPGGGNGAGAGDNAKSTPCDSEQDGSDADNKNSNKDDVCNKDSDDQETDGNDSGKDSDVPLLNLTPPDDGQIPGFVPTSGEDGPQDDPQDGPKSEDGPKGEEPPITEVTVTEVPEPLTLSLFAVGLVGAASLRRRSRKA
jgi:hypothetical protein